jgi:hypothetical protein
LTNKRIRKPNPEFVNIFIGSFNSQPFKIHLDVIIAYSPYFKTAFTNNEFEEGRTKSMRLKDVDEKVFGIFNNCSTNLIVFVRRTPRSWDC